MYFSFLTQLAKNVGSIKNLQYVERTNLVLGKDNEFSLALCEFDSQVAVGNLGLGKEDKGGVTRELQSAERDQDVISKWRKLNSSVWMRL